VVARGFAIRYIEDYNIANTARDLKISRKQAELLLQDPDVLQYVQELQDRAGLGTILKADFFNKAYLRIFEACVGDEEVPMVLATGEQIYRRKFDATGARAALNDLAKANGYLTEDTGNGGGLIVNINVGAMNGAEIKGEVERED
jgi:hypothetical protein